MKRHTPVELVEVLENGYQNVLRQWSGHLVGHLYLVCPLDPTNSILSPVL